MNAEARPEVRAESRSSKLLHAVVHSTGDGIFALFGAPAAYEDHPQRALDAALRMRRELREYGRRGEARGESALEARAGVNTGEVVVRTVETGGKIEYTPIDHRANLASRVQTMAPSGSIAASEHTRKLVEGYFELRTLGPMPAKGISEPIDIYEVTGLGRLRSHFQRSKRCGLTKFVGRERELEQMKHAFEQTLGGHGQVVAVMAEAGTGKSRLLYAWLPVIELLRDYFGVGNADDAAARREKVKGRILLALRDC